MKTENNTYVNGKKNCYLKKYYYIIYSAVQIFTKYFSTILFSNLVFYDPYEISSKYPDCPKWFGRNHY